MVLWCLLLGPTLAFGQNGTSFYFGEPQPVSEDTLYMIPLELQGTYFSAEDSSITITIDDTQIINYFPIFFYVLEAAIDTMDDISIQGDELVGFVEGENLPYTRQHDTLYTVYLQRTVMFEIDAEQPLGKLEQQYFLNYQEENGFWTTLLLELDKDEIRLYSFDHDVVKEEIQGLKQVKQKRLDEFDTYIGYPSSKELQHLIKKDGFTDEEIYVRLGEQ